MSKTLIILIVLILALALLIYISMKNPSRNRMTKIVRAVLFLVLLITIIVIGMKEYGPNGRNPIFSEAGRGENEGTDTQQTSAGSNASEGSQITADIVVHGMTVDIAGVKYDCSDGDYEELDSALLAYCDSGYAFRLADDYASSAVYHHLLDRLKALNAKVVEVDFTD